jgi:hypothetical protein
MTKSQKINALAKAMRQSVRGAAKDGMLDPEGEKYYHFTDEAPKELQDIFIEHYEVRDVDYETFSAACDIVFDIYTSEPTISKEEAEDDIYESASDSASVYTGERLSYLNVWNQDEVAEIVREHECDIATGAAIWYDKQVEQEAILINEWVHA